MRTAPVMTRLGWASSWIAVGLLVATCLMAVPSAFAVPDLQLYIPGSTYQTGGDDPQTWVTSESSFDLYLVGKAGTDDVLMSVALKGFDENADLSGVAVTINGTTYTNWQWGTPPLATIDMGGGGDLGKHDIYPTWFIEINAGDFAAVGGIGDAPSGWDPADGYVDGGNTLGEIKIFEVSITGAEWVHFDAYNLDARNRIDKFAPFSHDASFIGNPPNPPDVPEPGTMLLFGLGLAGAAVVRRIKR